MERPALFRKQYFLPSEHGAWIWWVGPLVIGLAAARQAPPATLLLGAAALSGFLLRQPAAIVVKALGGRRPRSDLRPGLTWALVYAACLSLATAGLVTLGHARILVLALPGAPVFVWNLWLIHRRAERGQLGVELVGAGVLALAAPAAYWVAGGPATGLAWLLWVLCWLQSAASIVLVYSRLEQRRLTAPPPRSETLARGRRAIAYHAFNLAVATGLAAGGVIPWTFPVAFGLMVLDLAQGLLVPPVGVRPTRIGLRQLAASTLFTLIAAAGFLL